MSVSSNERERGGSSAKQGLERTAAAGYVGKKTRFCSHNELKAKKGLHKGPFLKKICYFLLLLLLLVKNIIICSSFQGGFVISN